MGERVHAWSHCHCRGAAVVKGNSQSDVGTFWPIGQTHCILSLSLSLSLSLPLSPSLSLSHSRGTTANLFLTKYEPEQSKQNYS